MNVFSRFSNYSSEEKFTMSKEVSDVYVSYVELDNRHLLDLVGGVSVPSTFCRNCFETGMI